VERLRREARRGRPAERAEVERVHRRRQWTDWLGGVERQLQALANAGRDDEHVQTAASFARQLHIALRDGDDELAAHAARDLEAALHDLPDVGTAPTADGSPAPPDAVKGVCGNCGASMPPGYAFCGKCGVPLRKNCCRACGAALLEGFAFCGRCGAEAE
jgi:hypothetical protein